MARKQGTPLRTTEQLREISDYYKLNTKSVDDLVTADSENSPKVSEEELNRYRSRRGLRLPEWLKALLLKWWFAGAICFFVFWGLGIYLPNLLDMLLVFGIALGLVTDLLVNNILRFLAETEHANDRWMMFPKKGMLSFAGNILYAFVLLICVYYLYQIINGTITAFTGQTDSVPLGVEPILFGVFYMGFDMLFLGCKRLVKSIVSDARAKAAGSR